MMKAVADFPRGSAPGPFGLCPCLLYDILKRGPQVSKLISSLADFVKTCAYWGLPRSVAQYLAAATLIPLRKPDGGVRPITIGDTLRRLVGKVLLSTGPLVSHLKGLSPDQCGGGNPRRL